MSPEALLAGVVQAPEDDAPRLIYADWLEETGGPGEQARAEFIRVQCRLANLPADAPERPALSNRERELLLAHGSAWSSSLAPLVSAFAYRRGFVEEVTVGARQLLDNARWIFSLAPVRSLKVLRLVQVSFDPAALAALPQLRQLHTLDLGGARLPDEALKALLDAPCWRNLRTLRLAGNAPGRDTVEALGGQHLAGLKELDLSECGMFDLVRVLARRNPAWQLEALDLSDNVLGVDEISALAGWPGLAGLKRLNLANNGLQLAGATVLASSPHLGVLESLDLGGCSIGAGGTEALAQSSRFQRLRILKLHSCNVGQRGLRALLRAEALPALTDLELASNRLGDRGVGILADAPALARLRSLGLRNNDLSAAGVARLAASPYLEALQELDLGDNSLGEEGARALAASPHLTGLRVLRLRFCRLGPSDLALLRRSPTFAGLRELDLRGRE